MTRPKLILSWSSGKDSAWTLHVLRQQSTYEVVGLLTTVNERFDRVAMHAVPRRLVEVQAAAAGVPLWAVPIPDPCTNQQYEAAMLRSVARAREAGVTAIAFGDLFLADVRQYRERMLTGTGLQPMFPLWMQPTHTLAREMVAAGVRAVVTCVDPKQLSPAFAGRQFDAAFLDELPEEVDACGEKGEFHTFVSSGPMLRADVKVTVGDIIERDGFVFADLGLTDP